MSIKEIKIGSITGYKVPVEKLTIDPEFNIREDYGDIDGFANYIIENGITYPPIVGYVEGDKFVVTQGHRRRLATLKAIEMGALIDSVPVILENRTSSPEERIAQQISTNEGKSYTPLEKALVCKRLFKMGLDQARISKLTGIHKPMISNYLSYIAPQSDAVLSLIRLGKVSVSVVIDVAREVGIKRTYERLCQLNGNDPLLEEENECDDNDNLGINLDPEKEKATKEKKIKLPGKLTQLKSILKPSILDAEVDGEWVNLLMSKVEFLELQDILGVSSVNATKKGAKK